jgi:membrane protease YdiL (CAAX protease family)
MGKLTSSQKIYFGLILLLSVNAFIYVFMPMSDLIPSQELPVPKYVLGLANFGIMLFIYGGIGFLGLILSQKIGFENILNEKIKDRKNLFEIILVGLFIGIFFILVDIITNKLFLLPKMLHPPFPTSFFASINAGIGEEIIFRLFYISFWIWLFSKIIKSEKGRNILFWIVAILSALIFSVGHIPSTMILYDYKSFFEMPISLIIMIIGLNGILSIFCAYYFRKYGFLSAVLIHFFTDVVWHIIWGLINEM